MGTYFGNDSRRQRKDEAADYCGPVVYPVEPKESAFNDKGGKHVNGEVAEPADSS